MKNKKLNYEELRRIVDFINLEEESSRIKYDNRDYVKILEENSILKDGVEF